MLLYHNFSIADGHLSCFSFVITNYATLNILIHVFLVNICAHFYKGLYPGVELLSHREYIYSTLLEYAKLFSKMGVSMSIFANSVCSVSSPVFYITRFLVFAKMGCVCVLVSYGGLYLSFPDC